MRPTVFSFGVLISCALHLRGAAAGNTNGPARIKDSLRNARIINTNIIRPTVTKEMGDVGGKFFGQVPDPAKTKHYYIAVEPELWDYVPEGRDVVCGKPLPPELVSGKRAIKLRYVKYTDDTFSTAVMGEPRIGIMG